MKFCSKVTKLVELQNTKLNSKLKLKTGSPIFSFVVFTKYNCSTQDSFRAMTSMIDGALCNGFFGKLEKTSTKF